MKIGVIIPDRNDRPRFLANCLRMISRQTLPVNEVFISNEDSGFKAHEKDITFRYRKGYDHFRDKSFDCLLFIENDDWYADDYIETMVNRWIKEGKPELLGTNYTIYYNIRHKKWRTFDHFRRSSAMSTLIKPDLNFKWCVDTEPYTDSYLWMVSGLKGMTFKPGHHICMGIKHGEGLTGGEFHSSRIDTYKFDDPDFDYLKTNLDSESFEFYSNYFNHEN